MQIMDLASLAVTVSTSFVVGGNSNALQTIKNLGNQVAESSSDIVADGYLVGWQNTRVNRSSSVAVGNQHVAELLEQASIAAQGFLDTLKNPNNASFASNFTRDTGKGRSV